MGICARCSAPAAQKGDSTLTIWIRPPGCGLVSSGHGAVVRFQDMPLGRPILVYQGVSVRGVPAAAGNHLFVHASRARPGCKGSTYQQERNCTHQALTAWTSLEGGARHRQEKRIEPLAMVCRAA